MSHRIFRSSNTPIRSGLSWVERWSGSDKGLIACWENGRELHKRDLALANQVLAGELPVLVFKGGERYNIRRLAYWDTGHV